MEDRKGESWKAGRPVNLAFTTQDHERLPGNKMEGKGKHRRLSSLLHRKQWDLCAHSLIQKHSHEIILIHTCAYILHIDIMHPHKN